MPASPGKKKKPQRTHEPLGLLFGGTSLGNLWKSTHCEPLVARDGERVVKDA
jgi:hypothetical protein